MGYEGKQKARRRQFCRGTQSCFIHNEWPVLGAGTLSLHFRSYSGSLLSKPNDSHMLRYLSELCGIRHFFMVFRMLHLRKLLKKTELYGPTEERDMGIHKKKRLIKKLPVGLFLKPHVNILRATRKIFKCTIFFY